MQIMNRVMKTSHMRRKGVSMNKSKFQFSNPVLEKVEFLVNDSFNREACDGISMQSNTEVKVLDGNEAYVALTLNVGDESEGQPFNIMVKMSAKFHWDEAIDDEKAKKLLNINAPAALLSYIRPIISSMTGSSKYPALNIPFIDFTQAEME